MARERVDSFSEAKELYQEHRWHRHGAHIGPDIHAGHLPVHGAGGLDMDGIAADFDQLSAADNQLLALRGELERQLAAAAELNAPLADGTSPVTGPMRKAFAQRTDLEEGVQGALYRYRAELDAVRDAIANTLATYRGVDGEAVTRFNRVTNLEATD